MQPNDTAQRAQRQKFQRMAPNLTCKLTNCFKMLLDRLPNFASKRKQINAKNFNQKGWSVCQFLLVVARNKLYNFNSKRAKQNICANIVALVKKTKLKKIKKNEFSCKNPIDIAKSRHLVVNTLVFFQPCIFQRRTKEVYKRLRLSRRFLAKSFFCVAVTMRK